MTIVCLELAYDISEHIVVFFNADSIDSPSVRRKMLRLDDWKQRTECTRFARTLFCPEEWDEQFLFRLEWMRTVFQRTVGDGCSWGVRVVTTT